MVRFWSLFLCFAIVGCSAPSRAHHNPEAKKKYAQAIAKLTAIQKRVTQQDGTEPPFQNAYWNEKRAGVYVDVVSGVPLFSSTHKFRSGTGWPSFYQPIHKSAVVEVSDTTHGMRRIEVRSNEADSHLGHVFNDGPKPTGLRYCINSASLRFVPVEDLAKEGLGEYLALFKSKPNANPKPKTP